MTLRTSRSPIIALFATAAIIFAACGGAASAPPSTAPVTAAPTVGPTAVPFNGLVYPESGKSACGTTGYEGQMGLIKALDASTVEFTLCAPDAAFLSKVAFASLGIQDSDFLASTGGGGEALIRNPVGTGPYKLKAWTSGSEIALEAYSGYWGDQPATPNVVFRWSPEAAQRLVELQSGNVDGIDNPGPNDFATIAADPELALYPRVALSTMYLGMNNTIAPWDNDKVRQAIALGIDRKRIVDNFYPAGSSVADYFTPCEIPGGCGGDPWYGFDPVAAKALLTEAGFPNGFTTKLHLRDVVRGYLPAPVVVAQDIQDQLKRNLNITAEIDVQDASTYLGTASRGELPGLFILGWGADYPDVTNFLDVFFGVGSGVRFGNKWDDITGPLVQGGATSDPAARAALYTTANNAIRKHIPMVPMAHGGSGTAFRADVTGAHASPLGNELFAAMKAGDRDTLVWMQNGEPGGLYCPDETDGESLRVCAQIFESLYAYETGKTAPIPSLATACTANADSTVWTCTLREGVTFHNGSTLDANDVVTTYAVMWDAAHPLHIGRADQGLFEYWTFLFAAFLNPPPA